MSSKWDTIEERQPTRRPRVHQLTEFEKRCDFYLCTEEGDVIGPCRAVEHKPTSIEMEHRGSTAWLYVPYEMTIRKEDDHAKNESFLWVHPWDGLMVFKQAIERADSKKVATPRPRLPSECEHNWQPAQDMPKIKSGSRWHCVRCQRYGYLQTKEVNFGDIRLYNNSSVEQLRKDFERRKKHSEGPCDDPSCAKCAERRERLSAPDKSMRVTRVEELPKNARASSSFHSSTIDSFVLMRSNMRKGEL